MPVKFIQAGQMWRNNSDGKTYLVTKLYNEVFAQVAVLRQADARTEEASTVRIRVEKTPAGSTLPGYTFTQDF
jgi:CYTH domain-containing protein